jgi:glycosyltransferase involved in cell wall biosynthesis
MRIVILSDALPPDVPGGAGQIAWKLGHGLIAAGHQVIFITATNGPTRIETRQGTTVHLLHSHYAARLQGWFGLLNPQTIRPLNVLLRQIGPDVINAHNVHQHLGYHSLVIGRFAKAATVFTSHDVMPFAYTKFTAFIDPSRPDQTDGWNYRLPFGYNICQMRLRWNPARNLSICHTMRYYTDARIAVSHALKQALEANRLPPFEVVHNGVDPDIFNVPQVGIDILSQRFRLNGRKVILFGGRLNRHKGDQQILAALRLIKQTIPNVALLVLSPSSDYADRLLAANPDLAGNLVMGGWLHGAELASAYRLAGAVAVPSICFDSFPTITLEAMAAGSPPVTTCFGGGREAVLDGETGFVVNPYDISALADRLTRLLTDELLRRRLSEAGRNHVRAHFSLKHQVEATLAVYERALAKRHLR